MTDPVDATKAALTVTYPIWTDWAAATSVQYLILSLPPTGTPDEPRAAGASTDFAVDLRVKAVAGTPDGVRIMLRQVRDQLSPGMVPRQAVVDGWSLTWRFLRSEFIDIDQSITLTTGRHPAFGVDSYRLTSEPV